MSVPTLLALLLVIPARATKFPDCAREGKPPRDKPFLQDVLDCQEKARTDFTEKKRRTGQEPTPEELDALDQHQRKEVRDYISRNDDVGTVAQTPASQPEDDAPKAAGGKLGGLSDTDLRRVSRKQAQGLRELQRRIHERAADGQGGVTPQSVRDIEEFLLRRQGHISPEMAELLRGVEKDGGTLSDDTMKRLSEAAKAAKSEGLDLGIDPQIEKGLLEFQPPRNAAPSGPGSL